MNLSEIITKMENKNGIYIYNKSPFPKVDLDFDRTKFKTGDEKIYIKDSVTGKRFYVLILKLYDDDIENMIRMDIKMDNNTYTEIARMLSFKNTCRTNGFIIQSTNNYVEEDKQIILDENIGLVPEDETYVCISERPDETGYGLFRTTQFWTTKKLIEKIEKDASDYSGFFGF
jgi:hypothetical protein